MTIPRRRSITRSISLFAVSFAVCVGCETPDRRTLPTAEVNVRLTDGGEGAYVRDVKMLGASRESLHRLIGEPIEKQRYTEQGTIPEHAELLDNGFVWVVYSQSSGMADMVWFDFDKFSRKHDRRLRIKWDYKGKQYTLDDSVTPASLKAAYPEAFTKDPGYPSDKRAEFFILCDQKIMVHFWRSQITRVSLKLHPGEWEKD